MAPSVPRLAPGGQPSQQQRTLVGSPPSLPPRAQGWRNRAPTNGWRVFSEFLGKIEAGMEFTDLIRPTGRAAWVFQSQVGWFLSTLGRVPFPLPPEG